MSAPGRILELVDLFHRNADDYRSDDYNEARVRQEFINPMFKCLGWDMDNEQGYAEAYKDVIHEDAIKIGGATKAPDYCFRIGGGRKFFLEAKKPAVNLKDDPDPAYQLRRYAWSAKLPLSILTDFEELAVYDCRVKPAQTDKASVARTLYLTCTDYAGRWDEIAGIFSRDAVLKGSFDKYAETTKLKRGTATVDAAFLQEIEGWREMLAKNLALRNPQLSQRELNYAVQVIIDRIIFLRMCEDRGIERYGQLMALLNGPAVYGRLKQVFRSADDRYNSGLFHFQKEKDQAEPPDELTPTLTIDDKPLKEILKTLYYPDSPYEFSVLPVEILGQVYEQFLGKVIRLTEGHQAKVEDKPEVKKAGGVYYTPAYIVDYIVKHTVGRLLQSRDERLSRDREGAGATEPLANRLSRDREGAGHEPLANARGSESNARGSDSIASSLTPKQAAKLRILDPACGSGSFLLGAYKHLLDWHRDWYEADGPATHTKELYQGPGGGWRLTTAEKKRILLNNIYGVDIDPQAVEVTKLSLLLRVLEGESHDTLERLRLLWHERALPDLANNIKCGNSLIGPDFYDNQQASFLDEEERYRINVFDWNAKFPQIMKAGGFDAVIGNPPWGAEFSPLEQSYIRKGNQTGKASTLDSYGLFIERSLLRMKDGGLLGFITPDTFLRKDDYLELRQLFLHSNSISELVETGPLFAQVRDTWCLVFTVVRRAPNPQTKILHRKLSRFIVSVEERLGKFGRSEWDSESIVSQEVWRNRPGLIVGYRTSEREQALIRKLESQPRLKEQSGRYRISRGEEGSKFALEEDAKGEFCMVTPADVERYSVGGGIRVNRSSLTESKITGFYLHPKIWVIRIQKMRWKQRLVCSYDHRRDSAGMKTLQVIVSPNDTEADLKYLSGILASRLMNFWCTNYLADDINQSYLEKLPIRPINFADNADKARHDRMVQLVEQMLALHKQLAAAKVPHDQTVLQAQIAATDGQIDRLVYELYGLTEEEIRIVEGEDQ